MEAERWLVDELRRLGLWADIDPAGNVVGRWTGEQAGAVVIGSHLDTVPLGGRYDGALGVLCGLAAVRSLKQSQISPRRSIWLMSFMDEEGARFRTPLFGSRAFAGEELGDLGDRRDADGVTLREAMGAAGFDFERIQQARGIEEVAAYVELHIEQGRVLESAGTDVGVVTELAGMLGARALFRGRADHAGTTSMGDRSDALVGAARAVVALRDEAARHVGLLRMTVGTMEVHPGGFNVIPESCEFSIDVRVGGRNGLIEAEETVRRILSEIAAAERLEHEMRLTHRQEAVQFDPKIIEALAAAAAAEGASWVELVSGAGHDAMIVGRQAPAGMLFVPSRGGISHSPDEFTSPEACQVGARVLARAVTALSMQATEGSG